MPTAQMAHTNGIELCYETFGDADGEPLLLVMGIGAQLIVWPVELCDALADRGFHVIRYDNRDVGLSTKLADMAGGFLPAFLAAVQGEPVDVPYLLSDLAADAVGLLDALGIDAAHVVGASMGGMIAQTMAIEHRSRVRTLTSIMSTTGEPDVGQPTPAAVERLLQPPPANRDAAIAAGVEARRILGSPDEFDEERARALVTQSYDRCYHPAGSARQLLAVAASGSRADGLRQLDISTLVIHGDADPLVTPSGGIRTAELVPGARLLMVEGMGHDLPAAHLGPIVEAITALAAGRPAAT
ncbi:MAG: alpha/beta hydrolase [Acidimicrobiales bacterium]|nr:alpha/beta hydrolase [Acidimicrobiales bacterium]